MRKALMVACLCMLSSGVAAQVAPGIVPPDTDIPLVLDEDVSSNDVRVGHRFGVTVARDVVTDGGVVIPRGTHGTGEVTYRTGKGAFGKSGKMEIALRALDMGGRTLALDGRYREEGDGKTGVTVATIAVGGLLAGALVHGKNAVFEQGRELHARTTEPFSFGVRAAPVRPVLIASLPARSLAALPRPIVPVYRPQPATGVDHAAAGEAPAEILARRLAAAQPIRRADPRQGWTISD